MPLIPSRDGIKGVGPNMCVPRVRIYQHPPCPACAGSARSGRVTPCSVLCACSKCGMISRHSYQHICSQGIFSRHSYQQGAVFPSTQAGSQRPRWHRTSALHHAHLCVPAGCQSNQRLFSLLSSLLSPLSCLFNPSTSLLPCALVVISLVLSPLISSPLLPSYFPHGR